MYIKITTEGYPVLLKTRTKRQFFEAKHLASRKSPWVYITQNARGRWLVLTNEGEDILCIAGAPTCAQVLPAMMDRAREVGILDCPQKRRRSLLHGMVEFLMRKERGK